jgi:hypothetical protein
MSPIRYPNQEFNQLRTTEQWSLIQQFDGDLRLFASYLAQRFGSHPNAATQLNEIVNEIRDITNQAGSTGPKNGVFAICLYQAKGRNFISMSRTSDDFTLVWSFSQSEEPDPDDLDGVACLRKLAALALGDRADVGLRFSEQKDKAFMWKASSVHPLQVLENAFQRIVHKAGQEPDADPIKAQSETLARYFMQDAGQPVSFEYTPNDKPEGAQLSSVRINHLIETFYLFRLLVQYQVESGATISEDLRVDLSGNLTKLLHNGDPAKMAWLSAWLTEKIGEIGKKIDALNTPGKRRVIFFLKGGRALYYYLGTPGKGENDWDTQVVIDPSLPAEEWYQCFSDVHDVLLRTLETFKAEFTKLVEANAAPFMEYLLSKAGPETAEDEEVDENEVSDVNSRIEHANCKAELIDIGIPRRDSASGLEEWTRLSAHGGLKTSADGVIYPLREYYLNEYLMMIREAFIPKADVRKAPKRITRFGLILASDDDDGPSSVEEKRLAVLPETIKTIAGLDRKERRELFRIMNSQFVEAYNLLQDSELAALFDTDSSKLTANPPKLPAALADVLDDAQKVIAGDVGVAHTLSELMREHWERRSDFFEAQRPFFVDLLRNLSEITSDKLRAVEGQFAIAGSYAARLHADHLRIKPDGLEPIRRVLVKLQCPHELGEDNVLNAVRGDIEEVIRKTGRLTVADVPDPKNRSLVLHWSEKVTMGNYTYAPLVMKIRGAAQTGKQLPVLASIDGLPVLDLRYLVADYRRKTAKIDEQGSRRILASATAAISEMLSRFDFESDAYD